MERPLSSASSATGANPSATSGPGHKRSVSVKNATRSTGTSVVSLFVTNLRLLDLDLLRDWPNITPASFQDARAKIKCTEYALYQLFRLFDPATTADKLLPFFPPLEPLQSVNLRAALFRCLNELKKNGVLGKEMVLRKTMLDECQGDKFWEVCLGFSAIVLRKVALERRSKYGRPVAERLGTAQGVTKTQKESMLPLSIAHRATLSKVLDERQRKRETYKRLYDLLSRKEEELRQRRAKSQEQAGRRKALQPEKMKAVERAIERSWIGSADLKEALVNGDTCAKGDSMLVNSFDELWKTDGESRSLETGGAEVGLLQSLNSKATEQTARLRRWQNYHDRLIASKLASAPLSRPASGSQKSAIRFDRHRSLNPNERSPSNGKRPQQTRARHASTSRYDEILTGMREELRKASANRSRCATASQPDIQSVKRAQTQPVPVRRPGVAPDASPGASNPHARSPSQTAVPIRPGFGRRVSSRSKSYQQPKVISQRGPIQLKSELFSPLKGNRRSSISPISGSSVLPSPVEEGQSTVVNIDDVDGVKGKEAVQNEDGHDPVKHDSGLGVQANALSNDSSPHSANTSTSIAEKLEETSTSTTEFKVPALPFKRPTATDRLSRPSLAERTRKSMAFNSSEDINGFLPEPLSAAPAEVAEQDEHPDPSTPQPPLDRRTSLLERTRQSISMAPPPQPSNRSSHHRSRTSIYPINQFVTPRKTRRSTIGIDEDPKQRDITPMEQLFSPEAEYDSVFKSRPKIALSPVLSPNLDSGRVSMDGIGGLSDGEVGRSSPLVGVSGREQE